jgi:hypothetical protein
MLHGPCTMRVLQPFSHTLHVVLSIFYTCRQQSHLYMEPYTPADQTGEFCRTYIVYTYQFGMFGGVRGTSPQLWKLRDVGWLFALSRYVTDCFDHSTMIPSIQSIMFMDKR